MSALLARFWPLGVVLALIVQSVRIERLKADEVTWQLAGKDYQHAIGDLKLAIAIRDGRVVGRAQDEAADRGQANTVCTGEISDSFQKGVAVGRAIERHASSSPAAAAGQSVAPRRVRDYREARAAGAYIPGA